MSQFKIRPYTDADAVQTGILIADTYAEFNLSFASGENLAALLGPFANAHSTDPAHQQSIVNILRSPMMYVAVTDAEEGEEIIGVLRGRKERLGSLFVGKQHHKQGVARALVTRFEQDSRDLGVRVIRVAATLYAIGFYAKMGYKKSTGVRPAWSFGGQGLQMQPMKKTLANN